MKVPNTSWKIRKGPDWWDETAEDYFKGRRVLVISLPGAFTPIWSSEHLPGLEELHEKFKEKGIDEKELLTILGKMSRQRQESARSYEEAGKMDFAERELNEITIIEEFLPRKLDTNEIITGHKKNLEKI